MDQELLIIDLLSGKEIILAILQQSKKQFFLFFGGLAFLVTSFFFGLGTVVYHYLQKHVMSTAAIQKIIWLHRFSNLCGGVLLSLCLIMMLFILISYFVIKSDFQNWLEKRVRRSACFPAVIEDVDEYFLKTKKEIRLAKSDCVLLTQRFNGDKLMIGVEDLGWGLTRGRIFLLAVDSRQGHVRSGKLSHKKPAGKLAIAIGMVFLIVGGLWFYVAQVTSSLQNNTAVPADLKTEVVEDSPITGLLKQQGAAPDKIASQKNELYLDVKTHQLFQTTDQGAHWQFVPLKADWLRGGSYLLTSGEIPFGYFMEDTYQIGKDFSWYLYTTEAGDYLNLYLLISNDNGNSWQKRQIGEKVSGLRYRKVQFFENGSGIVAISKIGATSAEEMTCFITHNNGEDWYEAGSETVNAPVQNVSFINGDIGFIATRENIYYTKNAGGSYHEAVVNVPEQYLLGGLDIFQPPNEVTELTSTTLEAKFYLTKKTGHMYDCLYRSNDGGQTWEFVRELSEVTPAD